MPNDSRRRSLEENIQIPQNTSDGIIKLLLDSYGKYDTMLPMMDIFGRYQKMTAASWAYSLTIPRLLEPDSPIAKGIEKPFEVAGYFEMFNLRNIVKPRTAALMTVATIGAKYIPGIKDDKYVKGAVNTVDALAEIKGIADFGKAMHNISKLPVTAGVVGVAGAPAAFLGVSHVLAKNEEKRNLGLGSIPIAKPISLEESLRQGQDAYQIAAKAGIAMSQYDRGAAFTSSPRMTMLEGGMSKAFYEKVQKQAIEKMQKTTGKSIDEIEIGVLNRKALELEKGKSTPGINVKAVQNIKMKTIKELEQTEMKREKAMKRTTAPTTIPQATSLRTTEKPLTMNTIVAELERIMTEAMSGRLMA